MDAAQQAAAMELARAFREADRAVDLALHAEKPRGFFARVGGGGCRFAVYLGPDDLARGTVRVKNLAERTETEFALDALKTDPDAVA